jgi:hypothetical protein
LTFEDLFAQTRLYHLQAATRWRGGYARELLIATFAHWRAEDRESQTGLDQCRRRSAFGAVNVARVSFSENPFTRTYWICDDVRIPVQSSSQRRGSHPTTTPEPLLRAAQPLGNYVRSDGQAVAFSGFGIAPVFAILLTARESGRRAEGTACIYRTKG